MAIVSFAVSVATGKVGARYAAMMFMVPGVYASYVVGLAWVSNTLPRPAAKVSAFFFSFSSFSLSNSGRGKKKREVWCQTSACFWGRRRRGFVVKINQCDDFFFLLRELRDGVKWGIDCPPPPGRQRPSNKEKSILLICRGVRYTARRGSGIDQRRFKLILHLRLLHVSHICKSKIR